MGSTAWGRGVCKRSSSGVRRNSAYGCSTTQKVHMNCLKKLRSAITLEAAGFGQAMARARAHTRSLTHTGPCSVNRHSLFGV
eukprot:2610135-Amphidinium_carterae.1